MSKNHISFEEWKYWIFVTLAILSLVFITNFKPAVDTINSWNPIIQFLVINIGLWSILFLFFKAITLETSPALFLSLANLVLFLVIDTLSPEYHITTSGLVTGGIFSASSTDYVLGYVFHLMGIPNFFLPYLVYGIVTIGLFALAMWLYQIYGKEINWWWLLAISVKVWLLTLLITNLNFVIWFTALNPILQFLLYGVFVFIILFLFSVAIEYNLAFTFSNAFGIFCLFLASDIFLPEYHLNFHSVIAGSTFGMASSDFFAGYVLQSIGIPNILIPFIVYIGVTSVLYFIASFLLKNAVEEI